MKKSLYEATEEIQGEAKQIYENLDLKFDELGFIKDEEEEREWDAYETKFFDLAWFDYPKFVHYMEKNRTEEIQECIRRINEYNEFAKNYYGGSISSTRVNYEPDENKTDLYFFMDGSVEINTDSIVWEEFFKSWGFEKEAEELKVRQVFDKEKTDEEVAALLGGIEKMFLSYKRKIEEILTEKIKNALEEAQTQLDILEKKS